MKLVFFDKNQLFKNLFVPVCRNETEDLDKQGYPIREHVTFLPTQFPGDSFLMGKKLNEPNDHHLEHGWRENCVSGGTPCSPLPVY